MLNSFAQLRQFLEFGQLGLEIARNVTFNVVNTFIRQNKRSVSVSI